jgi:hypothetical protein
MQRPSCRRAGSAPRAAPRGGRIAVLAAGYINARTPHQARLQSYTRCLVLSLCLSASASASLCLCPRSSHPLQSTSTGTSTSTNTSKSSNTTPTPPPHANAFSTLPRLPRLPDCHTCRRCAHSTTSPPRSHDCARHDTACTLCLSLCGAAVPLHLPSPSLSPSPSLVLLSSAPALR